MEIEPRRCGGGSNGGGGVHAEAVRLAAGGVRRGDLPGLRVPDADEAIKARADEGRPWGEGPDPVRERGGRSALCL